MARLLCPLEVGGLFWRWAARQDPQVRRVSLNCLAGLASETLMPEPAVVELCFAYFHFLFESRRPGTMTLRRCPITDTPNPC